MSTEIDYYELLEVERTANADELKTAYRRLAMRHHPDRNPGCGESEAKFKALNEAYDCLKDPQKRAAYDRFGHAAFKQAGAGGGPGGFGGADFGDFADIFDTIFGAGFGGGDPRAQQRQRRGADLRYDMEISLEEAFHGKETTVSIEVSAMCEACDGKGAEPGTSVETCTTCAGHGKVRAQQGFFVVERTCPSCHGAGQRIKTPCRTCRGEGRVDKEQTIAVKVPPGVDEGTRIRLAGKGEAGPRGAPAGDLYIFLHIRRHGLFERDGANLTCRVPISFTLAALGGSIEVPGLDGKRHEVRIPAGIQSGAIAPARRGHAGTQHAGHGRPGHADRRRDADQTERTTERTARGIPRDGDGEECPDSRSFFQKLKDVFSA